MSNAKHEYEHFLAWLGTKQVDSDTRRVANIVLANFDKILLTTSNRSGRSIMLVPILQRDLDAASDKMPEHEVSSAKVVVPWSMLHSLKIGPFRGFRYEEIFDLKKRVILFYGPNGSGKSSICESIEYALLGSVDDAQTKRINPPESYLKNIHEDRYKKPILRAVGKPDGTDGVSITANQDVYQFCFVEKNRIDSFARMAARPAGQVDEMISALFGMEEFSNFVRNFNRSIDTQLRLTTLKRSELDQKEIAKKSDEEIIASEPTKLIKLNEAETLLAAEYQDGMCYKGLLTLIGRDDAPGRLKELEDILTLPTPNVSGIKVNSLSNALEEADRIYNGLMQSKSKLLERAIDVSFRELYNAITLLQSQHPDICPACETPLVDVVSNPYERAVKGLEHLKYLATIQEQLEKFKISLPQASNTLRSVINAVVTYAKENDSEQIVVSQILDDDAVGNWWSKLRIGEFSVWQQIINIAKSAEANDTIINEQLANRQILRAEWNRLRIYKDKVIEFQINRKTSLKNIEDAKTKVANFAIDNANLINEVQKEQKKYLFDNRIKVAYENFIEKLDNFRSELPTILTAGLNNTAMELYNSFNEGDHDADKLYSLRLPLCNTDRIMLRFRGNKTLELDALQVLSEGHIRCLGLSILLANNLNLGLPFILFDDAVNAIDHDHRKGIRDTLFGNDLFKDKQILMTCHSSEFIKDIQNQLPADKNTLYVIKNHVGNHQPRVIRNSSSHNYLVNAQSKLDELNYRDALAYCRQALENISHKLWKKLASLDEGELSLNIAGQEENRSFGIWWNRYA